MNKKAFTLIELLVVVLIIGILSAIALPQYSFAVEKARMTEALQNMATLQRALDVYVLEKDYPASSNNPLEDGLLTVELPLTTKNFTYSTSCSSSGCSVEANRIGDCEDGTMLQMPNGICYSLSRYASKPGKWNGDGAYDGECIYAVDKDGIGVSDKICGMLEKQNWHCQTNH